MISAKDYQEKIEELERRIVELERRPLCDAQTLIQELPKVQHLTLGKGIHS